MYDPARVTPLLLSMIFTVSAAYYISFYALPRRRKSKLSFEYESSSGIQKQSQLWQPDIDPKDVISRLPDDILVSILERMPSSMDVARTSAVSKRWASLYKSVSDVDICCENLVAARSTPHGQRGQLINYRAERILQLRSGSKIRRLVFCCCLIKAYPAHFSVFVYYLGTFGVEKLVAKCCCGTTETSRHYCDRNFHCCCISNLPSLKHLELQLYPLHPDTSTSSSSNSLQTLCLSRVKLIPGAVECVLSNCLSLQSMTFDFCECPPTLSFVGGPNLQLESLKMQQCEGLEEIMLGASNLVTLEIDSLRKVNIVFDHVPRLQTVYIGFKYINTMNYVCSTLPRALPQLKSLSFATRGDIYQVNSRPLWANNTFRNLEQLRLRLRYDSTKMNLLLLIPFIQSCPILEELHLDIDGDDNVQKSNIYGTAEEKKRAGAVVEIHSALKKVEITGFRGTKNEIEFARDLLKCGAVLEQMQICRCPKWHVEFVGWVKCDKPAWDYYTRETILSQLRGQALSKTARLTLQHFPTYTDAWWRRAYCN